MHFACILTTYLLLRPATAIDENSERSSTAKHESHEAVLNDILESLDSGTRMRQRRDLSHRWEGKLLQRIGELEGEVDSATGTTIKLLVNMAMAIMNNSDQISKLLDRVTLLEQKQALVPTKAEPDHLDLNLFAGKPNRHPHFTGNSDQKTENGNTFIENAVSKDEVVGEPDETKEEDRKESCLGVEDLDRRIKENTRSNEADTAAMANLASRVEWLERYTSPLHSAAENASSKLKTKLDGYQAKVVALVRNQSLINGRLGKAMKDLHKMLRTLQSQVSTGLSDDIIVDTSTAFLYHRHLNDDVRVRFNRQFKEPPRVFAAISGIAMDPDQASLEVKKGEELEVNKSEQLFVEIYTVQTNFYAVRIQGIKNIDTSGFSIRLDDGRKLGYSSFQWVQIQWIAIGH